MKLLMLALSVGLLWSFNASAMNFGPIEVSVTTSDGESLGDHVRVGGALFYFEPGMNPDTGFPDYLMESRDLPTWPFKDGKATVQTDLSIPLLANTVSLRLKMIHFNGKYWEDASNIHMKDGRFYRLEVPNPELYSEYLIVEKYNHVTFKADGREEIRKFPKKINLIYRRLN